METQCCGMLFVSRLYLNWDTARESVEWRHRLAHTNSIPLSLSLLHHSIHTYSAYIMDVIIIPACRHVAPASLLPPSKKAGTTGTQPDYPINLLWEQGRVAGGGGREAKGERGRNRKESVEQRGKERRGEWKKGMRGIEARKKKNSAGWVNSVFGNKKMTETKTAMRGTEGFQQTCGVKIRRVSTWYGNTGSYGDGKHTHSPDKGLAINGCLQSAAPPLVPPVTVVQPNKCLTLSKNPQATANSAPPSICCLHTAWWEQTRLGLQPTIIIIFFIKISWLGADTISCLTDQSIDRTLINNKFDNWVIIWVIFQVNISFFCCLIWL